MFSSHKKDYKYVFFIRVIMSEVPFYYLFITLYYIL